MTEEQLKAARARRDHWVPLRMAEARAKAAIEVPSNVVDLAKTIRKMDCVFLGEPTGEIRDCGEG